MSDWEEFCEANNWNAGSSADYDKFLRKMEDMSREPKKFMNSNALHFKTFEEAKSWAKRNVGSVITRDPDGSGFIALNKNKVTR